jgi:hypothetical protein
MFPHGLAYRQRIGVPSTTTRTCFPRAAIATLPVAVAALAVLALAPSSASAKEGDSLVGHGSTLIGQEITIAAHSGPLGENPQGQMQVLFTAPVERRVSANVTCLATMAFPVFGDVAVATAVGEITKVSGAPLTQDFLAVNVTDSGQPGGTGDFALATAFDGPPSSTCEAASAERPVLKGNFKVDDAQPAP